LSQNSRFLSEAPVLPFGGFLPLQFARAYEILTKIDFWSVFFTEIDRKNDSGKIKKGQK